MTWRPASPGLKTRTPNRKSEACLPYGFVRAQIHGLAGPWIWDMYSESCSWTNMPNKGWMVHSCTILHRCDQSFGVLILDLRNFNEALEGPWYRLVLCREKRDGLMLLSRTYFPTFLPLRCNNEHLDPQMYVEEWIVDCFQVWNHD